MPEPLASVVIPAHDEAASIADVLAALAPIGERIELVVACNGCSDATAAIARATAPWATVLELPTASKTAALQAGDDVATHFPRLYLDGDIVLGASGVRRLAELVGAAVDAAAPTAHYDTAGASWLMRSHYRWWIATQAHRQTLTGSGAIMVAAGVRQRFDLWPAVLGDDYFLDSQVAPDRKCRAADVMVDVRLPTTFRDCVRRRARIEQGNREVDRMRQRRHATDVNAERGQRSRRRGGRPIVAMLRRGPTRIVDLPAHAIVVVSAIVLATWQRWRQSPKTFYRDASRGRGQHG